MTVQAGHSPPRRWIEATTLGDLLDRRAAEGDEAGALAFPDRRVSYRELAGLADRWARGLRGLGVARGQHVGVLLGNSPDCLAVLFGAAKIGAVPVPVNNRLKGHELSHILAHGDLRILVTTAEEHGSPGYPDLLREVLPDLAGHTGPELTLDGFPLLRRILVLDGDTSPYFLTRSDLDAAAAGVTGAEVEHEQAAVCVRDTALILYSSGTTATPKGVMVSHEALTRMAGSLAHTRLRLTPDDRVWATLPFFHVGGIVFILASLVGGSSLCHVGFFQPDAALDHLERERCTVALASFETIWLAVLNRPDFDSRDLSPLRLVFALGIPETLKAMAKRVPHAVHVSCCGMTEAAGVIAFADPDDDLEKRLSTGGFPMPGMQVRTIDPETGADTPPGVPGELLYRGSHVFNGYYKDPELTAASFDADGWFHTGDLMVLDEDGRLSFVSRLKDMLKVGGENVAAAEVEGFLLGHPAVNMAQVVGAPDARYVEVPAAFVQLKPGKVATEPELIDFCRGRIASYRVPRYVRFVEEFPMSGTKVKKNVLRQVIADDLAARGITEAPPIRSGESAT
jgi:fatty-acyl-CoA synthase